MSGAHAAILSISPGSGQYKANDRVSVAIRVNTENIAINAVDGVLSFNGGALEVTSVSKAGSVIGVWVQEPKYSNSRGTVDFSGIILNPGYTGRSGLVLTVVFRVKASGNISFSSGSVLANDGYGTNVLRAMTSSTFSVGTAPAKTPQITPTPTSKPLSSVEITSTSHPDQAKWYSHNDPEFKWQLPVGAKEVSLILGTRANSAPTVKYIPPISEKKLEDVPDGIWYLNGSVTLASGVQSGFSYKFNVDTAPPQGFSLERVDKSDPTNPRPEFLWSAGDATSGINRYEVKVDDQEIVTLEPISAGKKYALLPQYPGQHVVEVKAFDNAGNSTEASAEFNITSIEPPTIKSAPSRVKDGQSIHFAGTAKPGYKVEVFSVNKNQDHKLSAKIITIDGDKEFFQVSEAELEENSLHITEAQPDEMGNWNVDMVSAKTGQYYVYARSMDDRGAVSRPSNAISLDIYKPGVSQHLSFLDKAWRVALDFLVNQWLWILAALLGLAVGIFLIERVLPVLILEWQRLRYISGEYRLHKELGAKTKRTLLELKMLNSDIKKELALLGKIEQHRGLQPDEKYLKEKLEKYSKLLKTLR